MRKKRILTEEHKRKIGNAARGKKHPPLSEESLIRIREAAAKRRGIKKGPRTEEVKKKISEATTGVKKTITKPNSSWYPKNHQPTHGFKKGLIPWNTGKLLGNGRTSNKYKIWRRQVKERDGNKCIKCGSTKRIHAHHIIPWKDNKELRFELSNGLTLCNSCHSKEECVLGIYGVGHRYKKGHIHSEETRKKLSLANKGKLSQMKGKKHSIETRKKLSLVHKGQKAWNKGKYTEPEKTRVCRICNIEKDIEKFTPQGKYRTRMCKKCRNKKVI